MSDENVGKTRRRRVPADVGLRVHEHLAVKRREQAAADPLTERTRGGGHRIIAVAVVTRLGKTSQTSGASNRMITGDRRGIERERSRIENAPSQSVAAGASDARDRSVTSRAPGSADGLIVRERTRHDRDGSRSGDE